MITRPFRYEAPGELDRAIELLSTDEDVQVLGGGTWVVPQMTAGVRQPTLLVDLKRLPLRTIELADGVVEIGATTTYTDLIGSSVVRAHAPLLALMASGVTGGSQVLAQGTIGGSACYATPSSDVPTVLWVARAEFVLAGPEGVRVLSVDDFFVGARRSACRADEILVAIRVPSRAGSPYGYSKLKFGQSSWPIVTAACLLELTAPQVTDAHVAIGGAGTVPFSADCSALLAPEAGLDAFERGVVVADPYEDVHADGWYRSAVASTVARRAVQQAIDGGLARD